MCVFGVRWFYYLCETFCKGIHLTVIEVEIKLMYFCEGGVHFNNNVL